MEFVLVIGIVSHLALLLLLLPSLLLLGDEKQLRDKNDDLIDDCDIVRFNSSFAAGTFARSNTISKLDCDILPALLHADSCNLFKKESIIC